MFALAVPVVIAELGWMTMGIVDTLMVGRSARKRSAPSASAARVFMGVVRLRDGPAARARHARLAGVRRRADRRVPSLAGARRRAEPRRLGSDHVLLLVLSASLGGWGLDPAVLALTRPYLDVVDWSVPPLLLYAAFRRYLQGMGVVRPVMSRWSPRT